jgi:hypothetical protein
MSILDFTRQADCAPGAQINLQPSPQFPLKLKRTGFELSPWRSTWRGALKVSRMLWRE